MNFRQFDLNLLKVFDAVMAERNLTRAADRLSMTQPAVSHALKRLREMLGEELFVRQAFGMRPTLKAEGLWPEVRAALAGLEQLLAFDEFRPDKQEHVFRIAMADATAALLLPGLVSQFEELQSLANVQVMPLTTRDPRGLLEQGEVDVAVGYFPTAVATLSGLGAQAPIRQQRLYDSEYVCVMRKGHPLAAKGALTLDAFCAAQHLLVSFSGRPHGFVDEALAALQRGRRIMLTVNQFFTAGRIVAGSELLTVLPSAFLEVTGYQSELVARPLPLVVGRIQVDMLWHLRSEGRRADGWLRERIVEAVRRKRAAEATISA